MHRAKGIKDAVAGIIQFVSHARTEHVGGAIRLAASAMLNLALSEARDEDAAQFIDLAHNLGQHLANLLVSDVMDRGDAPNFGTFARAPRAGVECPDSVFNSLLESRQ